MGGEEIDGLGSAEDGHGRDGAPPVPRPPADAAPADRLPEHRDALPDATTTVTDGGSAVAAGRVSYIADGDQPGPVPSGGAATSPGPDPHAGGVAPVVSAPLEGAADPSVPVRYPGPTDPLGSASYPDAAVPLGSASYPDVAAPPVSAPYPATAGGAGSAPYPAGLASNGHAPNLGGAVPPGAGPYPAPYWGGPATFPPEQPPPPRRSHRWGLGSYLLVEAVFIGISLLLGALLAHSLTTSAGAIALALSVPTVCAAGVAMLITRLRGNGPVADLGLTLTGRDIGIGLACGFGGLIITIPASILYVAIVGRGATSAVGEVFGGLHATPAMALVVFVIVVFLAPFCEEVVYRGLLWGAVEKLGVSRWWAMAITTVVFAVAHLEFTRTPLLLVVALPIGVARAVTGRLPAGVIAHQINNLLPGLALALGLLGVVPMQ